MRKIPEVILVRALQEILTSVKMLSLLEVFSIRVRSVGLTLKVILGFVSVNFDGGYQTVQVHASSAELKDTLSRPIRFEVGKYTWHNPPNQFTMLNLYENMWFNPNLICGLRNEICYMDELVYQSVGRSGFHPVFWEQE